MKVFRSISSKEDQRDFYPIMSARNAKPDIFYNRLISEKPDKKFYLYIDIEKTPNTETNQMDLYPNIDMAYYSPQINLITFQMPSVSL